MSDRSILAADDEDTCAVPSDVLSEFGHDADEARRGREVLEKFRRPRYLLDYRLPDVDRVELCAQLRPAYGVEAVLITAHAGPDVAEAGATAQTRALIPRPLDLSRLLPLVEVVVAPPEGRPRALRPRPPRLRAPVQDAGTGGPERDRPPP